MELVGQQDAIQEGQFQRFGKIGGVLADGRIRETAVHDSYLLAQGTPVAVHRMNLPGRSDEFSQSQRESACT
jgi:hypothetical protein